MPPKVDENECTGCETCVGDCPGDVLEMKNDKATVVRPDDCTECGVCEENCPADAIKLQ